MGCGWSGPLPERTALRGEYSTLHREGLNGAADRNEPVRLFDGSKASAREGRLLGRGEAAEVAQLAGLPDLRSELVSAAAHTLEAARVVGGHELQPLS